MSTRTTAPATATTAPATAEPAATAPAPAPTPTPTSVYAPGEIPPAAPATTPAPATEDPAAKTTTVTLGPDGQPFDPARALRTITALREEVKAAKAAAPKGDPPSVEERIAQLEARAVAAEHAAQVAQLAHTYNLPAEMVPLLKGETKEELAAAAAVLAKYVPKTTATPGVPGAPTPVPVDGAGTDTDTDASVTDIVKRMRR